MTQPFDLTAKQAEIMDKLGGAVKHSLIYGGSRSGKTFAFCYAIATRAVLAPGSRHAIFRRHGVAVKQSIGKDTMPKVLALAYPGLRYKWHEQDGYFALQNGSEIWLAGLDDKERVDKVLGKEFATLYFNEASEIPLASYDVAQTRLAQNVARATDGALPLRSYVDLNPTTDAHWTYQVFVKARHPGGGRIDPADYQHMVANPGDNLINLPPDYIKALQSLPERQRRRFFEGEYSSDAPNALWRRGYFKRNEKLPEFERIVVAIDPAATSEVGSDETGIVVAGMANGYGYVLADESGQYRPEEWAARAVSLYDLYDADRIIGEVNNGGEMIEAVLRTVRPNLSYTAVRASRGKVTRAEPIAALYERGKVFHVEEFPELENQMCSFTSDFDRKSQGYSPDRVDALVWAMTELFPAMTQRASSGAMFTPITGGWAG